MQHLGDYLDGTDVCFWYGKKGHKMIDCLTLNQQGKDTNKALKNGSYRNIQKKNNFYVLQSNKGGNP